MRRVILAFLVLALSPLAAAESSPVPVSAKWIIHFEWQRLLAGEAGPIVKNIAARPEVAGQLAAIQAYFGVDVLADVQSVSFFGSDGNEANAICAVSGKFNAGRLTEAVSKTNQYSTLNYAGRKIHIWKDGNKTNLGCLAAGNLLLVGSSETALKQSIDALDKAALKTIGSDLNSATDLGYCAVRDLQSLQGAAPKAAILQQITELRVVLDSKDKQFTLALEAKATSDAAAKNVKSIAEGLKALAALNADQDANGAAIAEKIQIQAEGGMVRLSIGVPAEMVVTWVNDKMTEKAQGPVAPSVQASPVVPAAR